MDETIIHNWNKVVGPNDTVYHLGDVGWWNNKYQYLLKQQLERLNGEICLIRGNHDKKLFDGPIGDQIRNRFKWVKDYEMIQIEDEEMEQPQKIVLFHYPIDDQWDCSFHGSFHLHGHTHKPAPHPHIRKVDVSVDSHNFKPISYDEIKLLITKRALGNR